MTLREGRDIPAVPQNQQGRSAMNRPLAFDILFEPIRIGPLVAKNRFYQVPHCNGMGRAYPSAMAAMRGVKAEGGWAVVCTEQCDVHHSGNHQRSVRLWDKKDVGYLARAADQIHAHGALAGIELAHNGSYVSNAESRVVPIAPSLTATRGVLPVTARAMDKSDIAAVRRWHRMAALNAKRAEFDIVYIYAGHDMTLPAHFLSRRHNQRTDEYGGSLENRARLLRELIEDAKDVIGDRCAVAVRFSVDELAGPQGITCDDEGRDLIALLAELPDLWDINIGPIENDANTSRFSPEAHQENYVCFVKSLTTKPVVGVGRFTSPDTMAAMIRTGVLDFIGAARPSIADPFLPRKIEEGRHDDIRECIGCNICIATDKLNVPIRCTQNPTMGEEWRRGWHPETIAAKDTNDSVLIIGAGPAGLEAGRALGQRGYDVTLVDRDREPGGRVSRESRLPGLASWARVRDWRMLQLRRMANVQFLPGNEVTAPMILEFGASLVAIATGASWRVDGVGRQHRLPIPGIRQIEVFTPDCIMEGRFPSGRVVVFDDDHGYMGGVIAQLLIEKGCELVFITPEPLVSAYTQLTSEQRRIQRGLMMTCAAVHVSTTVARVADSKIHLACVYTQREFAIAGDALVLVTGSIPHEALYRKLMQNDKATLSFAGIRRVVRIGDCLGPGTIAAAVYSGHLFARTLNTDLTDETPYRRENVELDSEQPLPRHHADADLRLDVRGIE